MNSATTTPGAGVRSEAATDRPGFAEAARAHLAALYSLARCLADDPGTAEDLVRRCLLKAYRDYGDLTDVDTLRAWLKQTLIVCGPEHWRAQGQGRREPSMDTGKGRRTVPDAENEGTAALLRQPVPGFLSTLEKGDVWAILERLKTIYRVPLVLVQVEGYTTAEVADLLDTALETVRSRLHEGRKQFQRQLWDYALERGLLPDRPVDTDRGRPCR